MKPDLLNSKCPLLPHWGLVGFTVHHCLPSPEIQPNPLPQAQRRIQTLSCPASFVQLLRMTWSSPVQHNNPAVEVKSNRLEAQNMGAPEEEEPRPPSDITVFGANCTLHGLSHIFLPGGVTIRRLLWALAFCSSLSIFLLQVADRVIEYYQYPYNTLLDEMDSPEMFFPAISLCNYNSFRKSQITRNDVFWMARMLGVEQGDFDDFMEALGQPTDNSKFFPSKTFNMLEMVQRTSHSLDEMLLDCKYRGKNCTSADFATVSMDSSVDLASGKIFITCISNCEVISCEKLRSPARSINIDLLII